MSEELKPCPFCGGVGSFSKNGFYVQCKACGCEGPYITTGPRFVAAAWNRRAQPESAAASVEEPICVYRLTKKEQGVFVAASEWLTGYPDPSWEALVGEAPDLWRIQRRVTGSQIAKGIARALATPFRPSQPDTGKRKGTDGLPVSAPRLYADEEPPEPATTGEDMLKLSHLGRALRHEEMMDRSLDRAKYPQPAPAAPAVACVTECEACFTPDACQLRGKCDHYSAEQLRIAKNAAPSVAPEPVAWKCVLLGEDQELDSAFFDTDPQFPFGEAGKHFSADYVVKKTPLFAHPPQAPLTEEQVRELLKKCGFDWHCGYMPMFDGDSTNSFAVLIAAVEAYHGIGVKP